MADEDSNFEITFHKVASKLLKEGFLLTALELHAELIENGNDLPILREFFSNPQNFEKSQDESLLDCSTDSHANLPRTSSSQTFDSLDFTRNSDDDHNQKDERIAVLEFELRKAREMIKSLRTSLTVSTSEISNISSNKPNIVDPEIESEENSIVKPHEKRALNYLINQYLLKYNYKLTSITFSDENEDQDFENWDDVGLNISNPPDLLKLYQFYLAHILKNS